VKVVAAGRMDVVRLEKSRFVSFDGGVDVYADYQCPDRYRMLHADLGERPRIARGAGYSSAAASLGVSTTIIDMSRFDRILWFNPAERRIAVEAGMTIGDLFRITARNGLWLPVQPGYPAITVGGCIAANVHGKNSATSGTFEACVEDILLFHPKHGEVRIDRTNHYSLFKLTCGGYGLTGIILSAVLRLEPLPGTAVAMERHFVSGCVEALKSVRSLAANGKSTYTWHDAAPVSQTFGRGIVYAGSFVSGDSDILGPMDYRRMTALSRCRFPFSIWSGVRTRAMNSAYRWSEKLQPRATEIPLFKWLYPFAKCPYFFYLFGRQGFCESQVLIPNDRCEGFLQDLQRHIVGKKAPAVCVSLKAFKGTQALLRFDGDGIAVTLFLVRSKEAQEFLQTLDTLTAFWHGIPNVIKDSRLSSSTIRACYPEYTIFREQLHKHDPSRLFQSELSQRLDL